MKIAIIIVIINNILWLFPPFRQWKNGYFYYFLLLGLSDPVGLLLLKYFHISPFHKVLFHVSLALIPLLYYAQKLTKVKVSLLLLTLTALFIFLPNEQILFACLPFLIYSCYIIGEILIKDSLATGKIKLYLFILLFYQFTLLLKILALVINFSTGIYFFYLTTATGALIAIFFTIYNLKNSPTIRLSKEPA